MSRASRANSAPNAYRVTVAGRVQGVGFRPLVYRLARRAGITGFVANSAGGALLEIEASPSALNAFLAAVKSSLPPGARITRVDVAEIPRRGYRDFSIRRSAGGAAVTADLPADGAVCPDCLGELLSPSDRRYRYPFINCTHCGPRFTIVKELPYDRRKTTMAPFALCPACRREYEDPENRRFHAQPNACPACGPSLRLCSMEGTPVARGYAAIPATLRRLEEGAIIAVKGIGGYHLACNALDAGAVAKLRKRKQRPHKPLAVMLGDVAAVKRFCTVSEAEEEQLVSSVRPIILLKKRKGIPARLSASLDFLAPGNPSLGVMLPYAPLHHLLFSKDTGPTPPAMLVMTSANRSDEPICRTERDVRAKLGGIADFVLSHNRPIHNRCDDSIVQPADTAPGGIVVLRRSRGLVPDPVAIVTRAALKRASPPAVFAAGAELKSAFCLTRGGNAYLSQHIGELDNDEALVFYREAFTRMKRFLAVEPEVIAHDLHPDYLSTRFAQGLLAGNRRLASFPVQHHQAHIASVLAEKCIDRPVIGFAFDGTGYGTDGNVWGGECFHWDGTRFSRRAHLEYFPLPGGDVAAKEIWRLAVSLLALSGASGYPSHLARKYPCRPVQEMAQKGVNSPRCSSAGRLFDAVAAILGVRTETTFEAQAAIELEALAGKAYERAMDISVIKGYNFNINDTGEGPGIISLGGIIMQLSDEAKRGRDRSAISLKFHVTLAEIVRALSLRLRRTLRCNEIVLSGGVFQNRLLLSLTAGALRRERFVVHHNRSVPPNDGGISLGQAWLALKG